jgi:predicted choloylglycine hydrolase
VKTGQSIRYILEVAKTVDEGVAILNRIPVHMAYNVTLIDASGTFATVYLSPDRPPVIIDTPVATNHQVEVEWGDYASLTGTIERKRFLDEMVNSPDETETSVLKRFLHTPLYNTNFEKSFGTLYTIIYRVKTKTLEIHWPHNHLSQSFKDFREERIVPLMTSARKGLVY